VKRLAAAIAPTAIALIALVACHRDNIALGNDTEAARDRPEAPAPHLPAAQALAGLESDAVQPGTMGAQDIASVQGAHPCAFRFTRDAWPSLLYSADVATLKLNGKLITLPRTGTDRFEDGGLRVSVTPAATASETRRVRDAQLILLPPGTLDERGYRGFAECGG
jgi:hypothetical protein